MTRPSRWSLSLCALLAACAPARRDVIEFGGTMVHRDLAYGAASASQVLDLHVPPDRPSPPLVVFVHGGAWASLGKKDVELTIAPFVTAGWAVANVEYRRTAEARAPAAAADVRCAIKWIARRAPELGVDASRIVLAGHSAGAHLALLAAFADTSAGLDDGCPGAMPAIAGVIDWAGITDVEDLYAGANVRGWAREWIGEQPDGAALARRLSPITWVRPGLPAVLIVHGDRDAIVPIAHARRLHAALDAAGVPNELVVLAGADHAPLSQQDAATSWASIMRFLGDRSRATAP